jgi:putative transposase
MGMVSVEQALPVSTQTSILGLNRTSFYYRRKQPDENVLNIKARIDRLYTKHPEYGYRRITDWLKKHESFLINHKAVYRHMVEMGIQAVYPRPDTSAPDKENKVYPYLLKSIEIDHPDHVWSIDITYIPIRTTWLYLVAIIDWYSRYVIGWMLDDTLEIDFVLETCKTALRGVTPEIMNSDQGSHFTSPKYTSLFLEAGSKISMDHRGRAYDNIFIERLWRSVKYENVYLRGYEMPRDARAGIREYMDYYNKERMHQSLSGHTPEEVYRGRVDAAAIVKENGKRVQGNEGSTGTARVTLMLKGV